MVNRKNAKVFSVESVKALGMYSLNAPILRETNIRITVLLSLIKTLTPTIVKKKRTVTTL